MRGILVCVFIGCVALSHSQGRIAYAKDDLCLFSAYITEFQTRKDKQTGDLIAETGRFFLGKPYIAATLENSETEHLTVNLREFDCTTLVETCLALSLTLRDGAFAADKPLEEKFAIYCQQLQKIRYRDGNIDGYASRLHYFTDWIYDNEKKKLVNDVTATLGGEKIYIRTGFMSTHPDAYRQLKNNSEQINAIRKTEEKINLRNTSYYISKTAIQQQASQIKDGDIIAFLTSIQGLDVSHTGIAIWQNNKLHLLHASLTEKKVVVSHQPLAVYASTVGRFTGILVVRAI
ncbi:MAG: DUF1460 domain-containing protein [Bacteroidales bacterium]|jgi:hypothetical protein|nr:DUF1460 domain-containing protein [Bacteroidales bacterium]